MFSEDYLDQICSKVEEKLTTHPDPTVLVSLLGELNVGLVLDACLVRCHHESYLSTACGASYAHPNGFCKLTLVDRSPAWSLRLHIWAGPVLDSENDCHTHRGYLVSRVVCGHLANELYHHRDDGTSAKFLCYEDTLDGRTHRLTQIGPTSLALEKREGMRAGDIYFLEGLEVHRSVPLGPFPVVTIVLQGPTTRKASLVYRALRRPDSEIVITSCPAEFFTGRLNDVLPIVRGTSDRQ